MRRPVLFFALAFSSAAAALVACTADDNTLPATPAKDASIATDGATASDTGTDTSTPLDSSTADAPTDSADAADAADAANPCPGLADGGDAGYVTLQANWYLNVSSENDGGGQLLSIHRCDSVQWTNTDNIAHSVQSDTNAFVGTAVNSGGPYAPIQFPVVGTFGYHCGIHGSAMHGSLTVSP